jgi:hypothetical protein
VGHFATANVSASCAASVFDVTPEIKYSLAFRNIFKDITVTIHDDPGRTKKYTSNDDKTIKFQIVACSKCSINLFCGPNLIFRPSEQIITT